MNSQKKEARERMVITSRLLYRLEQYNESVIDEDLPATEENCLGKEEDIELLFSTNGEVLDSV